MLNLIRYYIWSYYVWCTTPLGYTVRMDDSDNSLSDFHNSDEALAYHEIVENIQLWSIASCL